MHLVAICISSLEKYLFYQTCDLKELSVILQFFWCFIFFHFLDYLFQTQSFFFFLILMKSNFCIFFWLLVLKVSYLNDQED